MFVSGLDWSGDAGKVGGYRPVNPLLVVAAVHVERDIAAELKTVLARLRTDLRLPPDFCFKHQGASERQQVAFFAAVASLPVIAHARVVDKSLWSSSYLRQTRGDSRIRDEAVRLLLDCPAEVVSGQTLRVDLPRSELRLVRELRVALRQAMKANDRVSFRDVSPCPDHDPTLGHVVQVADMVAGELRERRIVAGPHLARFGDRLRLV